MYGHSLRLQPRRRGSRLVGDGDLDLPPSAAQRLPKAQRLAVRSAEVGVMDDAENLHLGRGEASSESRLACARNVAATNNHLRRAAWLCGLDEASLAAANDGGDSRGGDTDSLLQLLVCPACRRDLEWHVQEARCTGCDAAFPVLDGIPVLRRTEADESDAQKDVQASFFNEADPEFELSRPHGSPWLYRWLLSEKFRRSLDGLVLPARRVTAATICGGSGMDAEFLARVGASVISTDISLGAAR